MRTVIHCNDNWAFHKPGEAAINVTLPHTWNAVDGQDGGNDYWRGTASYEKRFRQADVGALHEAPAGSRVFLAFDGVAMTADVTLNGKPLAQRRRGVLRLRDDEELYARLPGHLPQGERLS